MAGVDNYTPQEIAELVEKKGVVKATAPWMTTLALAVLAGAFIALGGVFSTIVSTHSGAGFGVTRLLSGVAFSLGLILVVIAGAELFTGNTLVVMSVVSRRISVGMLLRHWAIVYVGNLAGALSIVALVYLGRWWAQDSNGGGATAVSVANAKASLGFAEAFFRGILANALVCLAVWLASSGRTVTDKVLAIVFPVAAFVAAGFEHSIANMYFLPLGLLLSHKAEVLQAGGFAGGSLAHLTVSGTVNNLVASTLGNIVGGGVLVGLVYWFIYLRKRGD